MADKKKLRARQRRVSLGRHDYFLVDTVVPEDPMELITGREPVISVLGGGDPETGQVVVLVGATDVGDYTKTPSAITAEVFMSADDTLGSDTLESDATWPHTLVAGNVDKYILAKVTASYPGEAGVVTWSNLIGPITTATFTQDPRPEEDQWSVEQEEIDGTTFGFKVTPDPALGAVLVQWTNTPEGSPVYENTGADADLGWEGVINDLVDNEDGTWSSPAGVSRNKTGGIYGQIGVRYKADALNPQWSLCSPNRIALQWTEQAPTKYYNMAIRSPEEFAQYGIGQPVQDGGQWFRSWDKVGDQVYFAHDVGGVWESSNDALLIRPVRGLGLYAGGAQSIVADPSFPDCFWHVGLADTDAQCGIYFSNDKGATAEISYTFPGAWNAGGRNTGLFWANKNLAVDPTTLSGATSQRRVYAVIQKMSGSPAFADGAQVVSREPGDTEWTVKATLTQSTHGNIFGIVPHPTKAGTVYLHCSRGLFKSINYGVAFSKIGAGIPFGEIRELWIKADSPSSGVADVIIFAVQNSGIYKTINSFSTNVTTLKADSSVVRVTVSDVDPNYIFAITKDGNNPWYSHNGGGAWARSTCIGRPGSSSQQKIGGSSAAYYAMSFIVPHHSNKLIAWAHGSNILFRTDDGGVSWTCWADGFIGVKMGSGINPVGFDAADPKRFVIGVADFSVATTENMNSFLRQNVPNSFTTQATESALCAGLEPVAGSRTIILCLGRTSGTGAIARSPDYGVSWDNVDPDSKQFTLFWDTDDVDFVYCGQRRSINNGLNFSAVGRIVCGLSADGLTVWGANVGSGTTTIYKATNGHAATLTWNTILTLPYRMYGGSGSVMSLQFYPPFAAHPTNTDRFYTITNIGEIVRYDGTTPTVPANGPLAQAGGRNPVAGMGLNNGVVNILIDPQNPEIVYAFLKCGGLPWCYMSVNDGVTWVDITENIPLYGAGASAGQIVHPLTGEIMVGYYLGTRVRRPPVGFVHSHTPISVSAQLKILH